MLPSVKISVYEAILAVDPPTASLFNQVFHHPIRSATSVGLEIHDMNTFWRIELSKLQGDTLTARSALRDDVSIERWLVSFINDVVPTIVLLWYPAVQGVMYE